MPTANPARVTQSGPGRFNHYWCVEARPPRRRKGVAPKRGAIRRPMPGWRRQPLQRNCREIPHPFRTVATASPTPAQQLSASTGCTANRSLDIQDRLGKKCVEIGYAEPIAWTEFDSLPARQRKPSLID